MQPRDYMTTFMFAGMIIAAVVGLFAAHPTMNLPMFTGFHNEKSGDMFPILFVTVACGAVSGFHSLVSSGTSSKTISNEKDMQKVGYGAMVRETYILGNVSVKEKGYYITESCIGCGTCMKHCPQKCIEKGAPFVIRQEHCLHCGNCYENCPVKAVIRK